jgi:aryl-alcohol dehydrogenase-like predicted oxidoreductase
MKYTTLGRRSGLRVSEYALGTANFGTAWGGGAERDESRKMFERFAEAGGTFVDAADVYSFGDSERMLGEFLGSDRGHFTVATKYGMSADRPRISSTGASRKNMIQSVEASLARLGTDYVDLLWVHWPDPLTPTEEILGAFDQLVSSGKVLYVGLSNFPAWQVSWATAVADLRGWAPLTAVQFEYSLAERTADRELIPMARALGLGVNVWSPLGGGLLTGRYRSSDAGRLTDWKGGVVRREDSRQRTGVLDEILQAADALGVPAAQVAMAWLLHVARTAGTGFIPIVGPRTLAQLDDYLTALDLTLPPATLDLLSAVSTPTLGVPHDGIADNRTTLLGGSPGDVRHPALPVV